MTTSTKIKNIIFYQGRWYAKNITRLGSLDLFEPGILSLGELVALDNNEFVSPKRSKM